MHTCVPCTTKPPAFRTPTVCGENTYYGFAIIGVFVFTSVFLALYIGEDRRRKDDDHDEPIVSGIDMHSIPPLSTLHSSSAGYYHYTTYPMFTYYPPVVYPALTYSSPVSPPSTMPVPTDRDVPTDRAKTKLTAKPKGHSTIKKTEASTSVDRYKVKGEGMGKSKYSERRSGDKSQMSGGRGSGEDGAKRDTRSATERKSGDADDHSSKTDNSGLDKGIKGDKYGSRSGSKLTSSGQVEKNGSTKDGPSSNDKIESASNGGKDETGDEPPLKEKTEDGTDGTSSNGKDKGIPENGGSKSNEPNDTDGGATSDGDKTANDTDGGATSDGDTTTGTTQDPKAAESGEKTAIGTDDGEGKQDEQEKAGEKGGPAGKAQPADPETKSKIVLGAA